MAKTVFKKNLNTKAQRAAGNKFMKTAASGGKGKRGKGGGGGGAGG